MRSKRPIYEYNYDMPETSGIYEIVNTVNMKGYVGQAAFLPSRAILLDHEHNKPLQDAYKKYGMENFTVVLLEECPLELLDDREIYWISKLHTHVRSDPCCGYNLTTGGRGVRGLAVSDDLRRLRSLMMLGNKINEGRIPTDYARERMSKSAPKTHSADHNKHVSEALKSKGIRPPKEALENSAKTNKERMKGNKNMLNKRFINNGVVNKAVDASLLDKYLADGWSLGMRKRGD